MSKNDSLDEPLNPGIANFQGDDFNNSNSIDNHLETPGDDVEKPNDKLIIDGKPNEKITPIENEAKILDNTDNTEPHLTKLTPEDIKLGGYPPLKTIFRLILGPILSQVTNALYGVITTIWVSKAIGTDGMSAISMMNAFDNIGRSFGFFLAIAAATQISFLYGKGQSEEAGQVVTDLIRLSFVCGAFISAVLIPIMKPIAVWYGADDHIVQLGFDYILPLNIFAFNSCLFIAAGGFLQGEGRTFLFGMSNVVCLVLNMACFNPLFLFVFKMGIRGASVATVVSEFIPAIIILALFYCHKFGIKPSFNQFCHKFSSRTWPALKVGCSSLIAQLSICIPSVVVRKYMGLACDNDQQRFADVMAGFTAAIRIGNLTFSILAALSQAYIPAASYSYAAKRYKRHLKLSIHMFWLMTLWGTISCLLTWLLPKQLSLLFSDGDGYLKSAQKMVAYNNAAGFVAGSRMASQSILQSLQMGSRATLLSFINNFVTIIVFMYILYYTNKHDPERIMLCYSYMNISSFFISILFLWKPLRNLYHLSKTDDHEEAYLEKERQALQENAQKNEQELAEIEKEIEQIQEDQESRLEDL